MAAKKKTGTKRASIKKKTSKRKAAKKAAKKTPRRKKAVKKVGKTRTERRAKKKAQRLVAKKKTQAKSVRKKGAAKGSTKKTRGTATARKAEREKARRGTPRRKETRKRTARAEKDRHHRDAAEAHDFETHATKKTPPAGVAAPPDEPRATGTIHQVAFIPAPPDDVYSAWLDSEEHGAMTGGEARASRVIGGVSTAWDGYITAKNLELEDGRRIVQEWSTTDWPEGCGPSRLELVFREVPGGCEIEMIHSLVPAEQLALYAEGWEQHYWQPMQAYFAERRAILE